MMRNTHCMTSYAARVCPMSCAARICTTIVAIAAQKAKRKYRSVRRVSALSSLSKRRCRRYVSGRLAAAKVSRSSATAIAPLPTYCGRPNAKNVAMIAASGSRKKIKSKAYVASQYARLLTPDTICTWRAPHARSRTTKTAQPAERMAMAMPAQSTSSESFAICSAYVAASCSPYGSGSLNTRTLAPMLPKSALNTTESISARLAGKA
mmetsp:Transcript_8624/g.35142  ORF Transcript_8624/g.35142 Transcript_8624/m.35142 type:complete len:208 (-) Transcript_8624:3682-4305(-)